MSTPSESSDSGLVATLNTLVQHGGWREPEAIVHAVAARNERVEGHTDLQLLLLHRDAAQQALTEVARDMHELDADAFTDRVLRLDLRPWPDLESWRVKLGVTLERRSEYAAAHRAPDVDEEVFDPVWGLAICPARDVAQVEDLFLSSLAEEERSSVLASAGRTVARLEREHPFVAARHSHFLRRIREITKAKPRFSRRCAVALGVSVAVLAVGAVFGSWSGWFS